MNGSGDPADSAPALAPLPVVERREFIEMLAEHVAASRRDGKWLGLLIIGLTQLDQINHDYGYTLGDLLLHHLAARLHESKRPADVLVRIGIEEFALILPGIGSTGLPLLAAQRMQARCEERIALASRRLKPKVRIGVAQFPRNAATAEELLRAADAALMQCKRLNQGIVADVEPQNGFSETLLETEHDLANALDNGELYCVFQPKIALSEGRLIGVEALSRWRTATGRMIPPARFIPVAEATGLIAQVTFRSLNESLRECAELQQSLPGLHVAVNLSAAVFGERHLRDIVLEALQIWQLSPELLTLEVTESAVMADIDQSIAVLKQLRDFGMGVSIDDFGTGHSSLAYLQRLPASELKIDRCFITGILANRQDRKLVRAIIGLAKGLGLTTVAEGIEDAATLSLLREMGCTLAQGYHIAKPLPPEVLLEWLDQSPWRAPQPRARMAAQG